MKKAAFAAALLAGAAMAQAADLELDVQGLASQQGEILVAVYAGPDTWLKTPVTVARQAASASQGGSVHVVVKDVPEGTVAVSLFHDLNSNGRLDMNAMGMPLEPYGFSNDAVGQFGPPTFAQASFELKAPSAHITVKLN